MGEEGRGLGWYWCGIRTGGSSDNQREFHEIEPLNDAIRTRGLNVKQLVAAHDHILILDSTPTHTSTRTNTRTDAHAYAHSRSHSCAHHNTQPREKSMCTAPSAGPSCWVKAKLEQRTRKRCI